VNDDTWTEGTITWNNQPGFTAAATDTTTVNNTATWFSWDVTADAQTALGDGTLSEMVKDTAEYTRDRWAGFDSKEATSNFEPYLEIEYDEPLPEDQGAVSFSVNGAIDPNFDGVPSPPGSPYFNPPWPGAPPGAGPYPHNRLPEVPLAEGLPTLRPGDVNDYRAAGIRSEGEIFQSEPNRSRDAAGGPISNVPSGTNNQILKDVALGLWTQNSNVNAYTFGEDWFNGDEDPTGGSSVYDEPWENREEYEFDEPTVATGGLPIKFYFSVDPWAIGLQNAPTSPTAVEDEATIFNNFPTPAGPPTNVDEDLGSAGAPFGVGPWRSNGEAAGDVFSADPILWPGINVQEYDEAILALWGPRTAGSEDPNMEDDLDALECVGKNSAGEPGNTHDRVAPTMGYNGGTHPPDLGSPTNANHDAQINFPIIFSVDRGTFGRFGSAVHAQLVDPNEGAAGDLFIAVTFEFPPLSGTWVTTNMLLIDEGQLGLMPHDDLDAVIVHLLLTEGELDERIATAIQDYNDEGPEPVSSGLGWTIPLLGIGQDQEAAVGFSVDTSSIGLMGTAVDFECRMDGTGNIGVVPPGSGIMEQPGDIFFANLMPVGPGQDRGTKLTFSTNFLWFEERDLGLDRGNWTFITPPGPSGDLADLPDELNALDSLWDEEDGEPDWPGYVKWLQPPDDSNYGIDIRCDREDGYNRTIADDFECNTPGPITDVHIWGSWKYDIKGKINKFHLSIHENIPDPDPGNPQTYSMPGRLLWERDINDFNEILYHDFVPADDWEWWWDPYTGVINQYGDQKIWQYDIFIDDPCQAFLQRGTPEDPCIYWLDVWVDLEPNDNMPEFGWKTSYLHWMDDAVMEIDDIPWWAPLHYPDGHPLWPDTVDMAFAITTEDCFPQTHPDYSQWVSVGRPYCWCEPRQCHGDADNASETKLNYWVFVNDLTILLNGWGKPYPIIAGQKLNGVPLICADFDHLSETKLNYRVFVNDLTILLTNWGTNAVPPDCP
jgi:hypothetical protein